MSHKWRLNPVGPQMLGMSFLFPEEMCKPTEQCILYPCLCLSTEDVILLQLPTTEPGSLAQVVGTQESVVLEAPSSVSGLLAKMMFLTQTQSLCTRPSQTLLNLNLS